VFEKKRQKAGDIGIKMSLLQ